MPTPSPRKLKTSPPPPPAALPERDLSWLVRSLLRIPRLLRILICAVFGFAVTLGTTPIIDYLYLRFIYNDSTELTRSIHAAVPALIEISLGLAMYMVGWLCFVGTRAETPTARPAVLWYFGAGSLAVFLVLLWIIQGAISLTLS
ncbi:MAG: hypothetical protein HXY40_05995 [Chloroflexi bacterium]|nr:hypothetical protein [Chloroflexota bacterium]